MLHVLATTSSSDSSGLMSMPVVIIIIALAVFEIIGMWKVFTKAGQTGWLSIIPLVNTYVLLKIAKRPGWWLLLYFLPIVNIFVHLAVSLDVAKRFGKTAAFGVFGLWLFSFIGYPMLGFGDAKYQSK